MFMNLIMKQVSDAEIELLAATANEIWHEFFPGIITEHQIDYMVEKFQSPHAIREQITEGYQYYLAYADDTLIGYTGIHPEEELLFLSKLYLKKQFRGKGYGREMLAFVIEKARERKKSGIYLTVNRFNAHSIAVYDAAGFQTVRKQVSDIGNGYVMDDYVMQFLV